MPKIYISNNYFYIEDNGKEYEGHAKEVLVRRKTAGGTEFSFTGVNNWPINKSVALADMTKEDGSAYTLAEFETFYKEGTGKSSGGGNGVGLQGSVATYNDLPPAADHIGKYYRVQEGSGGYVVFGNRIGGNDPGIYYSDGTSWSIRKDLDATDIKIDNSQYNHISTATNLRDGLLELETAIDESTSFWEATNTDTTENYIYKGGLNGTAWQINRYDRNNNTARVAATVSNNSGTTTLADAWTNRTTLNYV